MDVALRQDRGDNRSRTSARNARAGRCRGGGVEHLRLPEFRARGEVVVAVGGEGEHALRLARLQRAVQLGKLVLADEGRDGPGVAQDGQQRHRMLEPRHVQQVLVHNARQTLRQLKADMLPGEGAQAAHAVHRFLVGAGVHGGDDQMPGLGGVQGKLYGFRGAHLAHHDDVRSLAQHVEQPL